MYTTKLRNNCLKNEIANLNCRTHLFTVTSLDVNLFVFYNYNKLIITLFKSLLHLAKSHCLILIGETTYKLNRNKSKQNLVFDEWGKQEKLGKKTLRTEPRPNYSTHI